MKQPFGAPRRKQFVQKPGLPTGQDAASLGTVHDSSPVGVPRPKQFIQKPGLPTKQTSMADQNTTPHDSLRSLPSVGTPNAPWSSRAGWKLSLPTQQTSVVDQSTMPHSAIHGSSPMNVPDTPWPNQYIREPANQASITEQGTVPSAQVYGFQPIATLDNTEDNSPGVLRHILLAGLARLQEPQPEGLLTRGLQVIKPETALGLAPFLALTNAFGLLFVSFSYYISVLEYDHTMVEACFFAGLLIMVGPNLVRLLSRVPTRLERIVQLCVLTECSYFVQFMCSPLRFSGFDEFLHWRTADDLLSTGHLLYDNPMLPASPYFPGLEIMTNAVSSLTGLSIFYAGNIIIFAVHHLMILSIFLFYEYITKSSRMASIAVVIYMTNPHFIFFDTYYSYESLSLPLAMFMMYILARYESADKNHRWVICTAWLVLMAITITHHMTDYFFVGLLFLWAGVSFSRPFPHNTRIHLTTIATSGLFLSLVYAFLLPGNPVWGYLSGYFGNAFNQLEQIIVGSSVSRPLFANSVQPIPIWDRLLLVGTVALITFSLPFGLLILLRQYRDNVLAITFGIASLLYPLTQAFRFASFGTEIPERAAAFLFLPIAYMLTVLFTHFWPTRRLNWRAISLITSAILVIFLGGAVMGTGPNLSAAPGPYLVSADSRSLEPEGIETATWSQAHLGPNNRLATDRINEILMSTYGHQRIVTNLNDHVDVSPIFYSAQFDITDIAILREGQIHYLAVDTRISTALPLVGLYFENDRPTSIISRDALTKFNTVTQINRLFDSGDIVIYDTGTLIGKFSH